MKKRSSKVLSVFLSLVMICSFTLSGVGPVVTKAEETESAEKQEAFEDAFSTVSFYELLEDEQFVASEKGKVEKFERTEYTYLPEEGYTGSVVDFGAMVSAGKSDVNNTTFTISKKFDFGKLTAGRIFVNGLATRATNTKMKFLVDSKDSEELTEIGSVVLPNQIRDDNWTKEKEVNVDISAASVSGEHTVFIQFEVMDAAKENPKALQAVLRSIRFMPITVPVVTFDIDESQGSISDMNSDTEHNTECYGSMKIAVPNGYVSEYAKTEDPVYTGGEYKLDYIRGRGNSTWTEDKKPYKVKLDEAADLFNMGANKHWVLLANYYDNSLVRNRMTYWLGEQLGFKYTPQCINVDVVMNGEYLGNYLLCEQIRVDEARLDITDLEEVYKQVEKAAKGKNPEEVAEIYENMDVTGGYLLAMKPSDDETGYVFNTSDGSRFYVESPASDYGVPLHSRNGNDEDTSKYAKANAYITDYVQQVVDAIYGENFENEDGVSYEELMDVDSAVAYYWIQELSHNGDAYSNTSTYLFKDKNGKLCWGPIWDFDYVAWGSYDYSDYDAEGKQTYTGFDFQISWFQRLMEDPKFVAKAQEYWKNTLKPQIEEIVKEDGVLAQYEKELKYSAYYNFEKWDYSVLDEEGKMEAYHNGDVDPYSSEIARLRSWVTHRMNWIDANINRLEPPIVTIKFVVDGKTIHEGTTGLNRFYNDVPETPSLPDGYIFEAWSSPEYGEDAGQEYELTPDSFLWLSSDLVNEDGEIVMTAKVMKMVESIDVEQIAFEKSDYYTYYCDEENCEPIDIKYITVPLDGDRENLEWSSSDESIAHVWDGCVTPRGVGDAKITVMTPNNQEYSVNIHVLPGADVFDDVENSEIKDKYKLKDFTIDQTSIKLKPGEDKKLNLKTDPVECMALSVLGEPQDVFRWASLDEKVASVKLGYVTANAPGTTTIVVFNSACEVIRYCEVTVEGDSKPSDQQPPKTEDDKKPGSGSGTGTENTPGTTTTESVKVGTTFTVGNLNYKVTACKDKDLQVEVTGAKKSKATVLIPVTVKYEDKTYKVTTIGKSAFANDKKLKTVQIGKNITEIKSKAFAKCKKLKTIKVSSKVLKKVSKDAFQKIAKEASVKVPKAKKKAYKKLFKGLKIK